ncbi:MAG: helix-turn-helix domain-containing protein [Thermodesulfobacteriota bacterium]
MEYHHLLIAEDHPQNSKALLDALGEDYYLHEVRNSMEAIEYINNNDVDLVIMAYELPDIDGIETFMDIKALRPSLPVILTSSYLIGELILKAFRLGVRDFFKKPFQAEEVRDTVELILSYKKETQKESRSNVLLERYVNRPSVGTSIHSGIEKARMFLEENYTNSISLEQIANQASLSRHHCSRVFKKEIGISFSKYLTRLRVEKAKELLIQKGMSITKISSLVGYNEITYFERVFKKMTGLTPSTYRRKIFRPAT